MEEMTFRSPPVQRPRIPIWVVGAWPSKKSLNRAMRYDGLLAYTPRGEVDPEDVRVMRAYVEEHHVGTNLEASLFDIVREGQTPGDYPGRSRWCGPW